MFVPYKRDKVIDKEYHFRRNIPHGLRVGVERGDIVKRDVILASGEMSEEKARIDVSSLLEVKPPDTRKYLICLSGERVKRGDIVALRKKGVVSKEKSISVPCSGVVNLSEIDAGILKILGVAKETTINAGVEGKVISVIKNKQVDILCKVLRIRPFLGFGDDVQGELFFLNDPSVAGSMEESKVEIGANLKGEIIVLNFRPDFEFLRKLAMAGVIGLIMGGVSSSLLGNISSSGLWGVSVCVLEGFGDIDIDKDFSKVLKKNDGFLCLLDMKRQELVLSCTKSKIDSVPNKMLLKSLDTGDRVQIYGEKLWGAYGYVKEVTNEFVSVKCDKGKVIEVSANNLFAIDQDY